MVRPGKAPLGYRNVGHRTPEGREERTVEIDPDRAELITWAFVVFATGDWTLRSLADELETKGLTTRSRGHRSCPHARLDRTCCTPS